MSWRITVKCETQENADAFKEEFYKLLYEERGPKLVFELPTKEDTEPIAQAADKLGYTHETEEFDDPLEGAEPVDFW